MKIDKQAWYDVADVLERFMLFPIGIILAYGFFVWEAFEWVTALPERTATDTGIFTVVMGTGTLFVNFFTKLLIQYKKLDRPAGDE